MSEVQLIRLAQAGDQQAFRSLLETYLSLVQRVTRVLLFDKQTAEDITQEVWVEVWRSLPRFEAERPLRPWLLAIVANRCRMARRGRRVVNISLDVTTVDALYATEDIATASLQREQAVELRAVLAELKPEFQDVLALRYFAGLDLVEIANLTATPVGTIKSRLHRAQQALRQRLQILRERDLLSIRKDTSANERR